MDPQVSAQKVEHLDGEKPEGECEQFSSTTLDVGGMFLVSEDASMVELDSGATANSVCFRCLEHHNRLLERNGRPKVSTYPSSASFRFGGGSHGEVCHAADIPLGVAGN